MSITIPSELSDFVHQSVATGIYHDESAVVSEALRLLQRRDHFRRQVQLGVEQLDTGDYHEYDEAGLEQRLEEIKTEGRRRISGGEGAA